jgi:hypothetical protein
MKKHLVTICAVSLILICVPSVLHATQLRYQSPQQLGQQSSLVVQGKVADIRSYWNDKHTKIFTETLIQVDQTHKGQAAGVVKIIQLGGIVGNVKVSVAGALQWRPGEEVLLFLDAYGPDNYQVSGFSQGKFNIERDPQTGEPFIKRPALEGTGIQGAPSKDGAVMTSRIEPVPLNKFIDRALNRR